MIEGLLICQDGTVQLLGQPTTFRPYIKYLEVVLEQLRLKVLEEDRRYLSNIDTDVLTEELRKRSNLDKNNFIDKVN